MPDADPAPGREVRKRRSVLAAVLVLGISCLTTQLVLLRELLCVFAGNELVLGVVLGNWLLLMGVGASLGRRAEHLRERAAWFAGGQILLAMIPLAQVFAARVLRDKVFPAGASVGIPETFAASFVVLLPYCVIAGFLLTLACGLCAEADNAAAGAGRVYIADSVGSVLGGAVVSLLLLSVLDSFSLLMLAGLLNVAAAGWLARELGYRRTFGVSVGVGLVIVVLNAFARLDGWTTALQYPGQEVLFHGNSPYGRWVVTRGAGQLNFIENGLPVIATPNIEQAEETVHYALSQRPDARRVLLVGGGVSGAAKELLKYDAAVTCVELDPLLLRLGGRFLPKNLADTRLSVVNTDGRRFIQTTDEQFDVIVVDTPDPGTTQLNRYYTAEFFTESKRALATDGVLALAVGRYENVISPSLARVLATAHKTLHGVFTNVVMLPGGRVYFLASNGELGTDIAPRLERAQINTRFVNRHYLDAMLTPDRFADLQRAVAQPAVVNRDFNPALYFQCLRHWASQFDAGFGIAGAALAVALGVYIARLRDAAAAVFASGFTAAALEVVLLLAFQALCGSVYLQLGIVVTVFMAGLAAGAAWTSRGSSQRGTLIGLALAIAALSLVLPIALNGLSAAPAFRASNRAVQIVINLITFALATLVGAQFPVANRVGQNRPATTVSRVYTADFVGASLGALLASAWLIPLLGVTKMCWLAAGLNVLGAAAVWLTGRRST